MIQEQISTSFSRCLDGNAGFGVVAQTTGMAPNVSRDVSLLSGYMHCFSAGDERNPVVFLHAVRRAGGMDRHIVSRIADCGNDYTGRTNRIAHHLIIEESDLQQLPCGAAAILSQQELFRTQWNEKPQELPRGLKLPNPTVHVQKCVTWERFLSDAGWAGVVAERVENGDPVSLIFEPVGNNILPLISEVLTLLPTAVRWRSTFSTFFMKSQEPPGANKIQIKCIVANSDEMMFAKLSAKTLLIDLRKKTTEKPTGKYVDLARNGNVTPMVVVPTGLSAGTNFKPPDEDNLTNNTVSQSNGNDNIYKLPSAISVPTQNNAVKKQSAQFGIGKPSRTLFWIKILLLVLILCVVMIGAMSALVFYRWKGQQKTGTAPMNVVTEQTETEPQKTETGKTENESKSVAEKNEKELEAQKQAAEKLEQEQKAKAEENRIEQERAEEESKRKKEQQEKEERENKLKGQIAGLPDIWDGLGLPILSQDGAVKLKDSAFLNEIKEQVKISYIPFVNLEKMEPVIHKDELPQQIKFWREKDNNVDGNATRKEIAVIELGNDGLNFRFEGGISNTSIDETTRRQLNRILLAKLKVEVEGIKETSKEIVLYSPVKTDKVDTKKFTLWGSGGKEYVLSKGGESFLFLDIKKITVADTQNKALLTTPQKIVDMQGLKGYLPEVSYKKETGTCKIAVLDSDSLELGLSFLTHEMEKLLNDLDDLNREIDKKQSEKRQSEEKYGKLKEEIDNLEGDLGKKQEYIKNNMTSEIKKFKSDNSANFQFDEGEKVNEAVDQHGLIKELTVQVDKLVKDKKLEESKRDPALKSIKKQIEPDLKQLIQMESNIQKLKDELSGIKASITQCESEVNNMQIQKLRKENEKMKIEKTASWNNILLEEFSVYLLKPGTAKENCNEPENRLLLLDVKPDVKP
jgi:uncharacterized protein HemX